MYVASAHTRGDYNASDVHFEPVSSLKQMHVEPIISVVVKSIASCGNKCENIRINVIMSPRQAFPVCKKWIPYRSRHSCTYTFAYMMHVSKRFYKYLHRSLNYACSASEAVKLLMFSFDLDNVWSCKRELYFNKLLLHILKHWCIQLSYFLVNNFSLFQQKEFHCPPHSAIGASSHDYR